MAGQQVPQPAATLLPLPALAGSVELGSEQCLEDH